MAEEIIHQRLLVRYLLGDLSEEEQTWLEEKYFTDDAIFEELVGVEYELIDDYLRGKLSEREREQFKSHFLKLAERRERVAFARTIMKHVTQASREASPPELTPEATLEWSQVPSVREPQAPATKGYALDTVAPTRLARTHSAPESKWQSLVAFLGGQNPAIRLALAAGAVVLLFASWTLVENRRLRIEIAQMRAEQATVRRYQQQLQGQLSAAIVMSQRAQELLAGIGPERAAGNAQLNLERGKQRMPSAPHAAIGPVAVSLILTPGLFRGIGGQKLLTIPPSATQVRIRLELQHDDYPSYRAELQTEGSKVWQKDELKSRPTIEGGKEIILRVPSSHLKKGDYIVELDGVGTDGKVQEAEVYSFRVQRR